MNLYNTAVMIVGAGNWVGTVRRGTEKTKP